MDSTDGLSIKGKIERKNLVPTPALTGTTTAINASESSKLSKAASSNVSAARTPGPLNANEGDGDAQAPTSSTTIHQLPLLVTEKILLFLHPLDICEGNILRFMTAIPSNFRYWLETDSHFALRHLDRPSAARSVSMFRAVESKGAWSALTHTYKMAIYHALYSDCDQLQSHVREMVLSLPPPHTPHNNTMFFEACWRGHLYAVNALLSEDSVSPDFLIHGLNIASDMGRDKVVKLVLQHMDDPNFNVAETALKGAYAKKIMNVAEAILSCTPALSTTQTVRELMMTACRQNRIDFLELFLRVSDASNECMTEACQIGHHGVVEALLKHSSIDPNFESSKFLFCAAENHHYLVMSVLLRDPRSNPDETTLSELLITVCKASDADRPDSSDLGTLRGGLETKDAKAGAVELILARPGNHPTANNNEALRQAALNDYPTVLDLLLDEPRIPTSPKRISALLHVLRISPLKPFEKDARIRVEEYVQQISTDQLKQCLPFVMQNKAVSESCILAAVGLKNDALLGLLLEVPGVDPASSDNAALEKALRIGHMTAFSILLDKMIAPPVKIVSLAVDLFKKSAIQILIDSSHLRWDANVLLEPVTMAAERGHIQILRLLLAHAKLQKVELNVNSALLLSCKAGNLLVVNELLKENGSDPNADSANLLRTACSLSHHNIVRSLLTDGRAKPDGAMLLAAVNMDHLQVAKFLVADERTPIEENSILTAARLGREEILKMILNSPFLSSQVLLACSDRAIADATLYQHRQALKLLQAKRDEALKQMNEKTGSAMADRKDESDPGTATSGVIQDAAPLQTSPDSIKRTPVPPPAFSFYTSSSSSFSFTAGDQRLHRKRSARD
ncbi:hypothetical protein HDU78_011353 [Chytriomyces hyalinus]|nr:hypothetical protein HDU78_011353 [Chytriomyces hyalinus]